VLRRSTTLCTWASALMSVARSAFSFMVSILVGGGRAGRDRPRGRPARIGVCPL
jgi:hypothetical protein